MILFRSVKRGKNSKGGDRTELYLTQEQALLMINDLVKYKDTERGIKLDFHISERTSQDGRKFDSAICFIKPVQEFGAARGPGRGRVPDPALAETIAKVKSQIETQ